MTWLRRFLYGCVLVAGAYFLVRYRNDLTSTVVQHSRTLLTIVVLNLFIISAQSLSYLRILHRDSGISFLSLLDVWAKTVLLNYLGPFQPAPALRIIFLRSHGVPVKNSVAATVRQLILSLWITAGLAALSLWTLKPDPALFASFNVNSVATKTMGAVMGTGFLFGLILLVVGLFEGKLPSRLQGLLGEAMHRSLPLLIVLALVSPLATAYSIEVIYQTFGVSLGISLCIIVAAMMVASALFAILPNNLGLQEVLVAALTLSVGMGAAEASAASFTMRLGHIIAMLVVIVMVMAIRWISSIK